MATSKSITGPAVNQTLLRPENAEHHQAVRTLTKVGRKEFTDSIQALCDYVDPKGNQSSSTRTDKKTGQVVNGAYPYFTTQLYRSFGLSEKQAQARLDGESLRDILNVITLSFIYQAEMETAFFIKASIKAGVLRKEIKDGVREIFQKQALQHGLITSMAREAA